MQDTKIMPEPMLFDSNKNYVLLKEIEKYEGFETPYEKICQKIKIIPEENKMHVKNVKNHYKIPQTFIKKDLTKDEAEEFLNYHAKKDFKGVSPISRDKKLEQIAEDALNWIRNIN